jgi:hypothetical protein
MKASEMIPSKYLKKEDIERDTLCTVKKLTTADVSMDQSGDDMKWIIHFQEFAKGMVLNVGNIRTLEETLGEETDDWIGKKIVVYVDPNVMFSGKRVGGIRLRAPRNQAASSADAKIAAQEMSRQQAQAKPEFDDELPF